MKIEEEKIFRAIVPLLAGMPSRTRATILANLVGAWVTMHRVKDDPDGTLTLDLRADLLAGFMKYAAELVSLNAEHIDAALDRSETSVH